jgi:hypothetical protein
MRELKFRAWDKQQKKMYHVAALDWQRNEIAVWTGNLTAENLPWDEHMLPLQFTGLCDKNGKEIYEGDLILLGEGHDGPHEVKCNGTDTRWQAWRKFGYTNLGYHAGELCNIIGNIYENPELLK